jgi:glycolate oxidase
MRRFTEAFIERLKETIGSNCVYEDPVKLEAYCFDATNLKFPPDLVVEPRTTEQVSQLMEMAAEAGVPVVPRGAGSGITGGALAIRGGIILSALKMDRILEIDERNFLAVVEPGVINQDLQKAVEEKGLFYPPDPASLDTSSLGGNVAESAGGPRCLKYGTTKDYVLGLEVVLPNGKIINTGVRTKKGVVGYDLTHLFVGSEGTLGIITKIILRLIPKPELTATLLGIFPHLSYATDTVAGILRRGLIPAAIEFMDPNCLRLIRDRIPVRLPDEAASLLLVEVDGSREVVERESEKIGEICMEKAIDVLVAENEKQRQRLWDIRRSIATTIEESKILYAAEDIVVPIDSITTFVMQCGVIEAKYGLEIYCFGHAGDGNIHVNLTANENTEEKRDLMNRAIREVFELAIEKGGSLSGEHGVGITKKPFIRMELSEESIRLQKGIKALFDPKNILNPGKIFPEDD